MAMRATSTVGSPIANRRVVQLARQEILALVPVVPCSRTQRAHIWEARTVRWKNIGTTSNHFYLQRGNPMLSLEAPSCRGSSGNREGGQDSRSEVSIGLRYGQSTIMKINMSALETKVPEARVRVLSKALSLDTRMGLSFDDEDNPQV